MGVFPPFRACALQVAGDGELGACWWSAVRWWKGAGGALAPSGQCGLADAARWKRRGCEAGQTAPI